MKNWNEIRAWRTAQRVALIARRAALASEERRRLNNRITARLKQAFPMLANAVIGLCWPFKGEFDARFAARHWRAHGAVTALPGVVGRGLPLEFRKWWPGAPLQAGVYGIPAPDGTELVLPDALLVPMNAFDDRGYRIGYGGGYFDRTLAALKPRPLAIGVSFEMLRVETIYPQPHDVPMDFVITEAHIYAAGEGGLIALDTTEAAAQARRVFAERGLPRGAAAPAQGEYASPACYAHEFPGYFGDGENTK
jgi:5-formyltetrahydrofolate cyclo-ligase